jgi:hypothetical protein
MSSTDEEPQDATVGGAVRHRGANSEDPRLFGKAQEAALRNATDDLSWLLSRGYASTSAVKLVGDRYGLHARQRVAVGRAACTEASRIKRRESMILLAEIAGRPILIDGFNLLISIEAALSGGVILQCRDGCYRDIASVHGSYRSVEETDRALALIGDALAQFAPSAVTWVLDQPVSNSGRLSARILDYAARQDWPWTVEMAMSPDKVLMTSELIAVTSDSTILDNVNGWANVAGYVVENMVSDLWIVDLR